MVGSRFIVIVRVKVNEASIKKKNEKLNRFARKQVLLKNKHLFANKTNNTYIKSIFIFSNFFINLSRHRTNARANYVLLHIIFILYKTKYTKT